MQATAHYGWPISYHVDTIDTYFMRGLEILTEVAFVHPAGVGLVKPRLHIGGVMTARIGDEIMIISWELHEPVREGYIREVRHDLSGVVYLVQWAGTNHLSLLPHGPDVVIKCRQIRDNTGNTGDTSWRSRLRHPMEWHHHRKRERRQQIAHERLAWRVEEILAECGLGQEHESIAAGRTYHFPQVISISAGPPISVDIRMLENQSSDDFSAHTATIAHELGMAHVRMVSVEPSVISLQLVPYDRHPGHSPPSP
jgi:hypothetical protein